MSPTIAFYMAASLIGVDKGGIPGLGAVGMTIALSGYSEHNAGHILALFAPVLMFADIGAIYAYRHEIKFSVVAKVFPLIAVGMLVGFMFIGNKNDAIIRAVTGLALVVLSILYFLSKRKAFHVKADDSILPHSITVEYSGGWLERFSIPKRANEIMMNTTICIGTGILTVLANVAGPLIAIYLIKLNLSTRHFNGTRAVLFLLVNFIKIPVQMYLGNIELTDAYYAGPLIVTAGVSTLITERYLMPYLDESKFEMLAWLFVLVGGLKLLTGI